MNILIVTEVFYPENFHVNDFAQTLVERGYNVKVMTRQPSYPMGYVFPGYKNERHSVEQWGKVEIHRFDIVEGYKESKIKKIANYYHYVRRGKQVISEIIDDIDLIIVYQTGPLSLALPAIYAKKKFNIPVIVWSFDIWPDTVYMYGFPHLAPISTIVNHIIKKVYRNADAIMVSSKLFADTIRLYTPNADITYAPNWLLETESKPTTLTIDTNKVNFVFTGNISKAQNLENTVRGFIQAKIDNAILNIVGDGSYLPIIKDIVEKAGSKNIVFHGRVPYNEIPDVLAICDFLVLPLTPKSGVDKTEPFKIQSYLQSQKPILGIIRGAGKEIIEGNSLGVCCDPENIDDISQGFRRIIKLDDTEKQAISSSALSLMNTRFNKENIMETIETLIHRVYS